MRIEASSSTSPFSRRSTMGSSSFRACSKLMVLMSAWSVALAMACLSPFRRFQSRGVASGAHQRPDMHGGGGRQSIEIVASFKGEDELAASMFCGGLQQFLSHPGEISLDQQELRQRIVDVRVEASTDEEKVRRKRVERGQDARLPGHAESLAVVAGFERRVEDVAGAGRV